MNGVSEQTVNFSFENLKLEPAFQPFEDDYQILLGIVGDFSIQIDNKMLYREIDFCLVEFAVQANQWMNQSQPREDFTYTSMESEEVGLVWIKESLGLWRIGSVHQEYEKLYLFDLNEIDSALKFYLKSLLFNVPNHLQTKVSKMLS